MESDVAPFSVLGNLLKRIEPEYLKVFFPRLNLGAGKWRSLLFLVLWIEFASYNFVRIWRFAIIYLGCMHATVFLQQHAIFSSFFTHVYHRLIFYFALPFWWRIAMVGCTYSYWMSQWFKVLWIITVATPLKLKV